MVSVGSFVRFGALSEPIQCRAFGEPNFWQQQQQWPLFAPTPWEERFRVCCLCYRSVGTILTGVAGVYGGKLNEQENEGPSVRSEE